MSSNSTNCVGGMAFFPGGGGAGSGSSFMLHSPSADDNEHHLHHPPPSSLSSFLPSCAPPDHFHGMAPMLGKRSMSFTGMDMCEETNANYNTMNHHNNNNNNSNGIGIGIDDQELSDDGSQLGPGEKKRRLNMEQVRTLEKNFELGNKLEPERKMQLAKALGLQPRQIAIWFQNRRARWKTKQLEKDYESLKRQFDALKADNEALQALNHKLQAEIITMKGREPTESINLNKDTEGSSSNRSDNSSDIKLDISTTATATESPLDLSARMALFPPSSIKPNGPPAHLFHSPPPARPIKEEGGGGGSFNNMFCGMDDQAGFWPWLEQQHFN